MLNLLDLKFVPDERRVKTSMYASDFGKPIFELYHSLIGTPQSNPPEWYETLKWDAGKGVEMAMLKVLKTNGLVTPEYDQETHGKIEFERAGVPIHGKIDAKLINGDIPVEIKSVNNKNSQDIKKYENYLPRENYVGQLAVYMDALNKDTGVLFVAAIDGLSRFAFNCTKVSAGIYQCGNTVVDLNKEYARWARVWNMAQNKIEPDPMEYQYKYDIDTLHWKSQSKASISAARNGAAVLGDWQVKYSPYKDLWIQQQGATLGYSDDELKRINEYTKGYTSW